MNYYENIVLIDASLEDEQIEAALKRISETIEKNSGEILKIEKWGRRKLAYIVNKHDKGYYVLIVFKSPPATIKTLENLYKIFDQIFKFMIIKLRKKEIEALEKTLRASEPRHEEPAKADETQE